MQKSNDTSPTLEDTVVKHIADEGLMRYYENTLDEVEIAIVNLHLGQCWYCEQRLKVIEETMEEATHITVTDADRALVETLLQQHPLEPRSEEPAPWREPLETLASWLQRVLVPAQPHGGLAMVRSSSQMAKSEDGTWWWSLFQNRHNEHVLRLATEHTELLGLVIEFKIGSLSKQMVLKQVSKDQVGGEVKLTDDERAQIPPKAKVTIERAQPTDAKSGLEIPRGDES